MKLVLLLLAGCCLQSATAWKHLAPEDFRELVSQGEVLVAFIAPDEPRSVALEPEWLSAASSPKHNHRLISIDCSIPSPSTSESESDEAPKESPCDREGIDSLPLIVLFRNGDAIARYQGPKRADAIINFTSRLLRRTVAQDISAEELASFKTAEETVFVAYLSPDDTAQGEVFADVAREYREEFSFGTVSDASVAEAQGVKVPAVVCYKRVDGDTVQFEGLGETGAAEKLRKWVAEASRGVIEELTAVNRKRLVERGWPVVYLFSKSEAERQQLRKTLYKFARSYYDSLTSVLVDPLDFPGLMEELGLDPNVLPAGAVHQLSNGRIYHYPKDKPLSPNALQQWGLDVYQGRIKPWTPPGITASDEDIGRTYAASATAKLSMRSIPGVKIKIAGHDEL